MRRPWLVLVLLALLGSAPPARAADRFDIRLVGAEQADADFTTHGALGITAGVRVHERLRLFTTGTFFPRSRSSSLVEDLVARARQQPFGTALVTLRSMAELGTDATVLRGAANMLGRAAEFELFVSAAAGMSSSRIQLRWEDPEDGTPATYGSTGARTTLSYGAGVRVRSGLLVFALDVRRLKFPSTFFEIEGCSLSDLESEWTGAGCRSERLGRDVPLAKDMLREPTFDADWRKLLLVSLSAGVAF